MDHFIIGRLRLLPGPKHNTACYSLLCRQQARSLSNYPGKQEATVSRFGERFQYIFRNAKMVNSIFEFGEVWKEDKGAMAPGKLKLTDQNIMFKNSKTGKVDQMNNGEIESVHWQRLAGAYGLRVQTKSGNLFRFGGLQNDEKERSKLKEFFKEFYRLEMKTKDLSLTGRNWGTVNFNAASLSFDIDKLTAFEIPLAYVSNCATAKNEVTLEFHPNDEAASCMMEMRFYVPTDSNPEVDAVEAFKANVMSKAGITTATGDAIANFNGVQCLTPRGRYDIKIFTTFIQLHGKTFDYKIPVSTILRIFLLPHKDGRQMHFVLSLDPPIKQGQTRYHFLILLFNKDDEEDVSLSMNESDLKEKYEGKLDKEMSGPVFETLSRVVKAVVQRKITTPGNYKSMNGTPAISCTYKSSYGLLYPLEKGFIYVHKPPVHIRFEEISSVNFARSGGSTRSFDVEVQLRNQITHVFSSIEKDEYGRLYEYVKGKKLKIGNKQRGAEETFANEPMYDSDQEDDSGPDAYLHRVKNEAKQRDDDDDEDEDESDDDFNPDKASGGSDVGEEFDTDHDSTSSESDGEGGDKGGKDEKRKKHKAKTVREPGMGEKSAKKSSKSSGEGTKRKKKGAKKDANAPKRPQSAYFLWMAENRERIKKENPGISVTDIAKKGGEEWKAVSDKSKWEKQFEQLKEKYKQDVAEYQANKPDEDDNEDEGGAAAKSSKHSSSKKKSPKKVAATSGSGGGFKSREYISSSGSESDSERKSSKTKKGSSDKKEKPSKKKEESEEEEEEILDSPEASGSEDEEGSGSEEESMDED